jgi:hypothetical protein
VTVNRNGITVWLLRVTIRNKVPILCSKTEDFPASPADCGTIAAAMTSDIVANAIAAAISAGAVPGAADTAKPAMPIKTRRWYRSSTAF